MPNAYSLLVGLTEVDPLANYYRQVMGGFNGRPGCEGVEKDIERMERLTHHRGFHPIAGAPLLNRDATAAGVLRALRHAAGRVKTSDLFLLYLSCHGMARTVGAPGSKVSRHPGLVETLFINQFLMHDRPLFNFEILTALAAFPKKVRVVTIVDACHAGVGTGMLGYEEQMAQKSLAVAKEFLDGVLLEKGFASLTSPAKPPGLSTADALTTLLVGPGTQDKNRIRTWNLYLSSLLSSGISSVPGAVATSLTALLLKQIQLACELAHFGAARSIGVTPGGEEGSLFTRRLIQANLISRPAGETYPEFYQFLHSQMPPAYKPCAEWYPMTSPPPPCVPELASNHFAARESFLQA